MIYDLKERRLHIINDRCGVSPLNYAVTPDAFVFASEVAPLLEYPSVERTLDDTAVADFFAFGRLFGDKTFLKSVSVMPAGSILSYGDGMVTVERYREYEFQPDHSLGEREFACRLAGTFRQAVECQIRLPLRYGVLLSGGLDSRAIVGAMPEPARHTVTAFPHGQHRCEEIPIAERVAETAGMGCRPTEVTPELLLDDLGECVRMTDGLDLCMVNFVPKLSCALRDEGMDVVFHGLGLDSLLGWTAFVDDIDTLTRLPDDAVDDYLYRAWRFFTDDELAALFTPDNYEMVKAFPSVIQRGRGRHIRPQPAEPQRSLQT